MCEVQKIDLSKAKVGDRVRSVLNGWGELKVNLVNSEIVTVEYPHIGRVYYYNGKLLQNDLYPEIVEWIPQKRKVRKEITVWVNVYSMGTTRHRSEESAIKDTDGFNAIATAVPCTGTYEVEE